MTSNWIPAGRIRIALAAALLLAAAAGAGALVTPLALVLIVPGLAALIAGLIMLWVRGQLSGPRGWQARIHGEVVARLTLPADAAVLDIGCGDASLILALLEANPRLTVSGVDYWGQDWDYAKAACEARLGDRHASFARMDAARLEFPSAGFDAVVSVMCFHEVRPRGQGPLQAVTEALRVLRPGGAFVLVDRFADSADFAPRALAALLAPLKGVTRQSLVPSLRVPWPLSGRRALGPVEMIFGWKAD